ncbi:MAG: nucleotidyltransferase domain-containing protein [Candidatus Aenigmarchaeota archaeon]|nr:nucleotidyltransferase domain-containing protein [Candidatus Aenigmarchaeota archaeon]
MFRKYALFNVLGIFFREPFRKFYLREAAKKAKVSTQTAKLQLDWLAKNGFLKREKLGNLYLFRANYGSQKFRHFKIAFNIFELEKTGLVEYLKSKYEINSLVVFGSFAKGEDTPESDIDILLITNSKQKPDMINYIKKMKKDISLLQYSYKEWEERAKKNKPFYEQILIHGIVLSGNPPVI